MSLAKPVVYRRRATTYVVAASLMALAFLSGCPYSQPVEDNAATHSNKPPPVVRLLVIDDPALGAAIEREWAASGRGEVRIAQKTAAELGEVKRLDADVVIYPAAMLGDLVEQRLIAEFPRAALENEDFAQADIFQLLRRRECTWGEKVYAVPFGSPQFLLLYRKDVLEKHGLAPPQTWGEYVQAAVQLKQALADDETMAPVAEPLAEGWGAKLLLARAAAYVRHPNQYSALFDYQSMEPLVASKPYSHALMEIVLTQAVAHRDVRLTPAECEQAILDGKCAMAITWPTRQVTQKAEAAPDARLGCVELPGAESVYNLRTKEFAQLDHVARVPLLGISGRLGSITASARHTGAAAEALLWLAGKEKGPLIAAQSPACTLYRSSQVPQAKRFVSEQYDASLAREYGEALENANEQPLSLEMPRIPGHEEYLAALDSAVQKTLRLTASPEAALQQAAYEWQAITERHGVENQRKAYLRSLGLEP